MCGISGFIDFRNSSDREILVKMNDSLSHRGPDASGVYFESFNDYSIGLGHRRLSIIDLSELGNQPMHFLDERYLIVFNGEIYNYLEIKNELIELNHQFKSHSDTEVILHAFHQWGENAVSKFIGMFVFVIFDSFNKKIFCCRDRAGVKPFFYFWKNGLFLFGSELKALMSHPAFSRDINIDAVGEYMQYGYIPEPHSVFKDTYKLCAGHWLLFDLEKKEIKTWQYWNVSEAYNKETLNISLPEAFAETEKILTKAFNYRMVADVPVGIFLSGGYDSACLTALLQKDRTSKLKTFTIGFEKEQMNEAPFAKQIAHLLGTDHMEYICTVNDALSIVPELPFFYDEPFADSSAIPTILVSRMARQNVTVALSADAGDEIFGGYGRYNWVQKNYTFFNSIPPQVRQTCSGAVDFLAYGLSPFLKNNLIWQKKVEKLSYLLKSPSVSSIYSSSNEQYSKKEKISLFLNPVHVLASSHNSVENSNLDKNPIIYAMLKDYKTYLADDILQKVDRATMSVSLEGREPFLDHHIIEWAAALPMQFKINSGQSKYILKKIVHKYLPEELMDRKKMGFSVPLDEWLKSSLKPLVDKYFSKEYIQKQQIFDDVYVSKIYDSYYQAQNENTYKIWYLLMFQMWYDKWMNS